MSRSHLWDFLLSIPNGMTENNKTIFLVVLSGGAFGVIFSNQRNLTGRLDRLVRKMGGNSLAVVPIIELMMSMVGGLGGRKCKCSVCATWTVGSTKTLVGSHCWRSNDLFG